MESWVMFKSCDYSWVSWVTPYLVWISVHRLGGEIIIVPALLIVFNLVQLKLQTECTSTDFLLIGWLTQPGGLSSRWVGLLCLRGFMSCVHTWNYIVTIIATGSERNFSQHLGEWLERLPTRVTNNIDWLCSKYIKIGNQILEYLQVTSHQLQTEVCTCNFVNWKCELCCSLLYSVFFFSYFHCLTDISPISPNNWLLPQHRLQHKLQKDKNDKQSVYRTLA